MKRSFFLFCLLSVVLGIMGQKKNNPSDTAIYNIALHSDIDVTASAYVNANESPEKACDNNISTK